MDIDIQFMDIDIPHPLIAKQFGGLRLIYTSRHDPSRHDPAKKKNNKDGRAPF